MAITRKKVAYILRKYNLLKFIDYLIFLGTIMRNIKSNKIFLDEHPEFIPPPYHLAYDAYGHTNWETYFNMGLRHAELISDLIKEYVSESDIKICEWGCGPARVIRHLRAIDGFHNVELFGTDYNEKSVAWCNRNISNIQFSENNMEPPLGLNSGMFDCVYAISIFTHLSEELHYTWISELFRILKPNGILIFTTHGDSFANRLMPEEKEKYNTGHIVSRDPVKEGRKCFATFHPPQFIKKRLLNDHQIIKHISNATMYQLEQDVWCAKKNEN